ncbi:glycoprotein-N-acetylgalactosamine 3-beta-galactosyltransferase 1-like [Daphnia pulex]|uniref:glycoprotein-N-acetylgalactosamine 3-beta-galactosyltransferase 1-like n=1 Tax=Daphnia pulex TaxID=6669 RepID=UPI001EDD658F|nr:glycoprotein-N-acetylgalactosamine 3-beta-galactosyltransferase 1-like [Daphnia pulex]XP_046455010.1 glycoprotein-N-acetylgalactosamine 3-beta-galactosyltransferase 1-like [Daphnia pulex]XP_046455011.1 glycoprotein-N-acetylgalactosamine 3-beta-galactosyltransferase 1-like [Daphnia pulex]XP_046455012.1 glycoprotein-N-acetylgalactosamine 3-beta-galactosyltransferase 1-like [Daphnia pulex]
MFHPPRRRVLLFIIIGFGCCIILFMNQLLYTQQSQSITNIKEYTNGIIIEDENNDLYSKVRVLCWVMTSPDNHKTKALAVKETWGKRCNILLFMSSAEDSTLPTVNLPVREGRNGLWGKTREAFRYAWNNYRDQADWFLKADDDTYVIVENLRYFLSAFNTSTPLWFGHKYKVIVKSGYFSGGAGYALSKEATRRFVEEGYFNALKCRHDHEGAEDAEMGKCMENLNVSTMDTRDSKGRGRFFPFVPEQHYFPGKITPTYWYWNNIYYPPTKGKDCCSDSAISFHYVNPQLMHIFDYLIYQLRPYGMPADQRPATPEPPPDFNLTALPWFAPPDEIITIPSTSTTEKNSVLPPTMLNTTLSLQQNATINQTQLNLTDANFSNSTNPENIVDLTPKSATTIQTELNSTEANSFNLTSPENLVELTSKTKRAGVVNKLRSAIFG